MPQWLRTPSAAAIVPAVIGAIAVRIGEAWAIAAALQLVLWLVQLRTKNAGIVDVGWAGAFAPVIALFAWQSGAPASSWWPIAAIAVAWSVRLTTHLLARGAASSPEEGRYVALRTSWGASASTKFFVFFQAQAALVGILSLAFVVPFIALPSCPMLVWIGAALSLCGVIGESIADAQLARFRRDHKGKVCDSGLWSWSRHPNYFFEWCVWLGYAIHGLAFYPYGVIAIVPQALLLCSILFVTGIPPTEKQSLASRGDLYRAYQARVSKFVPSPPKRSARDA
jgi:steroid 5-alpha reductase family enzyme